MKEDLQLLLDNAPSPTEIAELKLAATRYAHCFETEPGRVIEAVLVCLHEHACYPGQIVKVVRRLVPDLDRHLGRVSNEALKYRGLDVAQIPGRHPRQRPYWAAVCHHVRTWTPIDVTELLRIRAN